MRLRLLIGPLVLLLLWTLVTSLGFVKPLILPSPLQVIIALKTLAQEGRLWRDLFFTFYRTILAFIIAGGIGLLIGIPLGLWRKFYESLEIVFDFFRSLPSPALIPLAMLLFGLGDLSRIAVAAFTCSLINAIQTTYAVQSVPRYRILAAKIEGANLGFLIRFVFIPSILPGVVAGWRITLSLSLIIIVVTEMFIGTRSGLGMQIADNHLMFRTSEMYAYIFVVGFLGYLLNKTIEVIEKRLVHWTGK